MKNYIDIVKHIIDNYNFTTYRREFKGSDYHSDSPFEYYNPLIISEKDKFSGITHEPMEDPGCEVNIFLPFILLIAAGKTLMMFDFFRKIRLLSMNLSLG